MSDLLDPTLACAAKKRPARLDPVVVFRKVAPHIVPAAAKEKNKFVPHR